ncbi:MAG: hypothetical protein A3K19_31750 [Lentisphaerae bacterium RIFOXYB12_FULL_65_16]|nr:MAG: hypothetical protein A3K18_10530 [Lentisphaerae bacterium RIFOXYA12_64_32]OGV88678.1 MAG: hypothetical protein A3K19_31750 [Lentisphaerae bacterium RIFOXYB12_FULL_65_16]
MRITPEAAARLRKLLTAAPTGTTGFRLRDISGTCRGATPMLAPAAAPQPDETCATAEGVALFIPPTHAAVCADAVLDYDGAMFGRGLALSWPHRDGCPCQHGPTASKDTSPP